MSAVWALGDESQRREMEAAHAAAVSEAMAHLTETVPTVRRRYSGQVVEEPAREVVAAEYRHTTSRGVLEGDAPDPQLHSHVVITNAIRDDGRIVAVASRPVFRAAREIGAYYRSALAHQLSERGYAIEAGTGKQGRYFEIAGVPQGLLDAFSARSREVARAAERFRAKWGRAPERGELRRLKLENRKAKVLVTRGDLHAVWNETAARFDFTGDEPARLLGEARGSRPERALADRVEERLTERAATFEPGEFRAVLLEQSVGELSPREALAFSRSMIAERRVLPLEGGLMTTLAVRAREQAIERRFTKLAQAADRDVGAVAREIASDTVAERIGGHLSDEQAHALQVITGPERGAILVGPAGTGKGVVIDAAARAEQLAGHQTLGVAVSWSTAERLGRDSPALSQQVFSVDALVSRVEHGQLNVDADTTIYFDEAGMADTNRLDRLTEMVERTGAKLVAVGDAAQLPSIGAGGMFDRLTEIAPSAELSDIRRTLDPEEQRAWADLRAGRSDRAMAHYHSRGQLHMADTRDQAVEHAVKSWAKLTENHPIKRGRVDLRRLEPGDPPSQRPRTALPRTTRRARRAGSRGARRPLRHPPRRPDSHDRAAPRARSGAHRERQPRRSPRHHPQPEKHSSSSTSPAGSEHSPAKTSAACASGTRSTSTVRRARPSPAPSSSPAAGRPARSPPTSRHPAPAKAPAGSSPAKTSESKATTPTASNASPPTCAAATHKPHRSRTPNYPTPNRAAATRTRSHPAAAAGYPASPAPSTASSNPTEHRSEHDEPQAVDAELWEPRADSLSRSTRPAVPCCGNR